MFRATMLLALLATASAQSTTDNKPEILAKIHRPVHDLVADLFTKDDATLEGFARDTRKMGKIGEFAHCNTQEIIPISALPLYVKQYRAKPSPELEGHVLLNAFLIARFHPAKREELSQMLEAAFAAFAKQPPPPPHPPDIVENTGPSGPIYSLNELRDELTQVNPPQIEISKEELACHWISSQSGAEPKLSAGPAYETIVGPDGKVTSAKVITGGELPGWAASVKRMRFQPFYLRGEAITVKSIVIPK